MIGKITIATLLILGLNNISKAQNEPVKDSAVLITTAPVAKVDTAKAKKRGSKVSVEIGLNANTFVKQFLSFNTFLANNQQPYLLTGKLIFNSKWAIRTGLGFTNTTSKSSDLTTTSTSTFPSSPITTNQKSSSLDYRFGFEYQKKINYKWRYYVGADFILNNNTLNQESVNQQTFNSGGGTIGVFTTTNKTSSTGQNYGGAGVVGVQYNINKRISFFTEANAVFTMGKSKSTTETSSSSDNPSLFQLNSSSKNVTKSSGTSFGINLPVTLFIAIKL